MPNTIAQNLARLQAAKTSIGAAITAKGGTVASGDGLEEFATDIGTIPSGGGGGGGDSGKPVRFLDYDGTVVASYTAEEFAQLTAMPSNPTHAGLTAQGWNWSFSDAQAYVAANGMLDVGQMYITDDGKTRLYIELTEGRISPWLKLYLNANSELDIDWGDGTPHSAFTSTNAGYISKQHIYSKAGNYVISIGVTEGSFNLQSSSTNVSTLLTNASTNSSSPDIGYLNSIKKIEIGSGVDTIGQYAFYRCFSLEYIIMPSSIGTIEGGAFYLCYSLKNVIIPTGVDTINNSTFNMCNSLQCVSLPNSITTISLRAFECCYSLCRIIIPNSVSLLGGVSFDSCYSLTSVIIPSSVMSINNNAFSSCYTLTYIKINKPDGSISGSPWGAITGSPTYTQIIWTG